MWVWPNEPKLGAALHLFNDQQKKSLFKFALHFFDSLTENQWNIKLNIQQKKILLKEVGENEKNWPNKTNGEWVEKNFRKSLKFRENDQNATNFPAPAHPKKDN